MVKDFIEGIQYMKSQSGVFQIIMLVAIFSLLGMPFITLPPVFAAEIFHRGPDGFGLMVGATGAGALAAAVFLAFRGDIKEKTKFMSFAALAFSSLLFVFSFTNYFSVAIGILVFIGWSLVSFFAVANSYIQLSVPDNLRGRAMSVYAFVFLGTAPIGNSIIGAAASTVGTTSTVGMTAVVCFITSIIFCRKICGFPTALPEAAAAFPSRFVRDGLGTLVAVDARPINIAQRDIESIRWGFNFSRSIGAQARAAGAQQTQQGAPPRQHGESSAAGAQAAPSFNPGGGGAGRWNLAVYQRLRLTDDLVLAPGLETIDLLDRGGLNGGGETASSIEFEGGLFYRGVGLRLNGGWTDAYATPVASGGQLNFSDRWTINARVFVNFDQRPSILEAAPFLRGGRLSLGVDNLTDSHVEVRDETGVTPTAYQEGYQSPLGRVVQLSFQKQF